MLSRHALASCRRQSVVKSFSRSLATEVATPPSPTPADATRTKKSLKPRLTTAVILNRSPLLTRTPTLFERAYYAYQSRIKRALHNPFPYEFYFKQGSPLETRFNIEERKRERKAFGKPFTDASMGVEETDALSASQLGQQEGEGETIMPRVHEADTTKDYKSLDRKGKRNIYLLVNAKENGQDNWRFPQGGVEKGELLHQAAQRDLYAECGQEMDTWIVSRNPVGVYEPKEPTESSPREVTFFFKAHILAGQVRPESKSIQDFAWLTKQEIESRVKPEYWEGMKDILSDH